MKVINVINRLFRTPAYAVLSLRPISQELDDKDQLDQGLQSKNLDPRQRFGNLARKPQEWSQLRQGRDPPGLLSGM